MHKLLMSRSTCSSSTRLHSAHENNYPGISGAKEAVYLKNCYNSKCLSSVFCWALLVKSTQMINGDVSPMSPLTVQRANLHAGPSESLTHHSQPGKRRKVSDTGNDHGAREGCNGEDQVSNTNDQFQASHFHSLIQLHLSQNCLLLL